MHYFEKDTLEIVKTKDESSQSKLRVLGKYERGKCYGPLSIWAYSFYPDKSVGDPAFITHNSFNLFLVVMHRSWKQNMYDKSYKNFY